MTQRSVTTSSVISKPFQSKTSLIAGLHKGSMLFRIGKSGFKVPRYQNTYRLKPYKPFQCEVVDKILINVMRRYLISLKYEPEFCMQICKEISTEVCEKICKKFYDRYKIVVFMSIVQKLGQSVQIDFGKLWDVQRDTYSTYTIETAEFIATGLVVGIYYE
ncbi:dynein light chain Tctex-type 5-like [Linepithema humile]|uniref:dynein light chain Tctex-type 5-like n=1 Tax=Linepithema humile TaxID=83485 RepID=UPI00351E8AB1